mmetsp:Transcript_29700/g.75667  ORF Transcript_29700/g.75667 Transcript_29700/m.75667 type:complete len:238 (+) Transcript_29700:642-1355(+)
MDARTLSSSTQYGTARTMSGNSVAVPWMNLENLCTSVRYPLSSSSCTQGGAVWPSGSDSFTSSTACGKRVISVRWMGSDGSRYQRPDAAQVGPSSGFSLIMHRFVSSDTRTVASNGIWNAVRMYCVRTKGRSCLESTALNTSMNISANLDFSSSLTVLPLRAALASMSTSACSTVYSPSMNATTLSSLTRNRSLTLSSPFQLSLCVLRSMNTVPGGALPYQRTRSAIAPGFLSSRPW